MTPRLSLLPAMALLTGAPAAHAEAVRVKPAKSSGGPRYVERYADAWTDIPESFRDLKTPEWKVPDVRALLDRAGGDPRKAEKGIIFIDGIDHF